MTTTKTLKAGQISRDESLSFRSQDDFPEHVRTLVAVLKRGGDLDPVLVWREQDGAGRLTGRMVLLDGAQRMKAYRSFGRDQHIPVTVFEGSKAEAAETAVTANARVTIGLCSAERTDAAWRLVWFYEYELSKPRIMKAAGVSSGTVAKMRRRAREMREQEAEFTGDWRRDSSDRQRAMKDFDEEKYEAEWQQRLDQMVESIRSAMGWTHHVDTVQAYHALEKALGEKAIRAMFEYGFGDELDERTGTTPSQVTGADGDEDYCDGEDF